MKKATEQRCWSAFINGSDTAFRSLYLAFVDRLFSFGYDYCQDRELVKDAIQDLFVDLHRYRSRLDPDAELTAYLFTSLRRKLHASLKKSRNQKLRESGDPELDILTAPTLEENMIRKEKETELTNLLSKEMERLPGRQREILYLRYIREMSYQDIARTMNISVATSRTLVYRAVRQLRKSATLPILLR